MGYSTLQITYYLYVHFVLYKCVLFFGRDFGIIGNALGRLTSGFLYRYKVSFIIYAFT